MYVQGQGYESTATITRPNNTTAYTANDAIGEDPAKNITFERIGGNGAEIIITDVNMRIDVSSVSSGMSSFRLHLYKLPPTAITDNSAYNLPSADRSKYLGYIDLVTPQDNGDTLWSENNQINKKVKLYSSSLYGILETKGAFTPTAQCVKTITLQSVEV
jgi:hypothetical protein